MLKSVYDANGDGVVDDVPAHKASHENTGTDEISVTGLSGELVDNQPLKAHALGGAKHTSATLEQLNALISNATLDDSDSARTPSAHKASHQDGGTDEIDVTGLVGTTPTALLGDATPGRVLRRIHLTIDNGTNANTIKPSTLSQWNGDTIPAEDNLPKGGETTNFALDEIGYSLTIKASGLTGNVVAVVAMNIYYNLCGTALTIQSYKSGNDINCYFYRDLDAVPQDLTVLVDTGLFALNITYLTDE
jgi:hypothetical protein